MKLINTLFFSAISFLSHAAELPKLNLDTENLTVSGLSSGGYMAAQYHLAHSNTIKGVGIIAAGPIYCAQNDLMTALAACINKQDKPTDLAVINQQIQQWQQQGDIANLRHLKADKLWLFHSTKDEKVITGVSNDLFRQYQQWLTAENMTYVKDKPFAHHFPTRNSGSDCQQSVAPYLGNCGYDAAGEMLSFLLDDIKPASESSMGAIVSLAQKELLDVDAAGMADTGYVYIPQSCASGQACQLHINFHGCNQFSEAENIGTNYIENNGLNRWADTNQLVVLYPQTKKSLMNPFNPQGCWDWWGYTNEHYATQKGLQVKAVNQLVSFLTR